MSLRPSPIASTSAASIAELLGHVGETGRLVDAHRGEVEPGGPPDDVVGAVQAEPRGELDEVVGGRVGVADDHAADRLGDHLVHRGDELDAAELAVRERLAHPVAAAPLLDRHPRPGVVPQHRLDGRRRVEGDLVHDLDRRVAEDHRAVGRHHPEPVGVRARQVEQVGDPGHAVRRAAAGQHDVRPGVEGAAHRVVHRVGDHLVGLAGALDPLQQRAVDVEGDQARPPGSPARRSLQCHQ